jgi:hypothetical protein
MSNNKNKCETCPICLDTIRNINSKRVIKQECCNKPFHKKCINKWYKVKKICPLCRTKKKSTPLFNTEEREFLTESFLGIAPMFRPLYRSYGGDNTMNEISNFISLFQDSVNIVNTDEENDEEENIFNDLTETLVTAKNIVRSFRTIMNTDNENENI